MERGVRLTFFSQARLSEKSGSRDAIRALSVKRQELRDKTDRLLASDLKQLQNDVDTRDFARKILSFSSKMGIIWDKRTKSRNLVSDFRKNVIDEAAIADVIHHRYYEFNEALFDIDEEGMKLLKIEPIDVELAERSKKSKDLDHILAPMHAIIEDGVSHSLVGNGVSIGAGLVAGTASYNAIRSSREHRPDGSVNRNADLEAAVGSFLVGLTAEIASEYLFDRTAKIADQLEQVADQVFGQLLDIDAEWKRSFDELVESHDQAFLKAVAKSRGVELSEIRAAISIQVP